MCGSDVRRVVTAFHVVLAAALAFGCARGFAEDFPVFNAAVGTQTFGPLYHFTADTKLVETAEAIYGMGSDIIKMDMSWNAFGSYQLTGAPGISNLMTMASYEPSYQHVFGMPFSYYLLWAYSMGTNINWHDGMDAGETTGVYKEFYELTAYLLTAYNDSGKSFLLGLWEGDWALLDNRFDPGLNPSNAAIRGMIDWLTVRQRAVADARAAVAHTNVKVYHYAEVNLVKKGMDGGTTMVNNVLPYCTNDLVSYSAYEIQADPMSVFTAALSYVESRAPTAGPFAKNVFIGEYAIPADPLNYTLQEQADLVESVTKKAAWWGCPFVLFWQTYSNETNTNGTVRGYWLIDDTNTKVPAYFVHQDFLGRAHTFKNMYRFWLRRNPDPAAFMSFSLSFDTFSSAALLNQVLDSDEFTNALSNAGYAFFLLDGLFGCTSAFDPDFTNTLHRLDTGVSRRTALDDLINSARFSNRCPNGLFAEMLLGGTLRRDHVAPTSAAVQAVAALLDAGAGRAVLWRQYLDTNEFHRAELDLRQDNDPQSRAVFAKYFFDFDRDQDGLPDAWERRIIDADPHDALSSIEDVSPDADYDGDGLDNGAERNAETDPVLADSDGDWLKDGEEIDNDNAFVDPLDSTANLVAVLNTRFEKDGEGEVAFLRTNSTPEYSEAIADWQRGGNGGAFFSVTGTPIAVIDPVVPVRAGTWGVSVQFFSSAGSYTGEPGWVGGGILSSRISTNVSDLAAQDHLADAAFWRLRFRIGPCDNGGTEPGFLFTRLAALPEDSTDPLDADSDGDEAGDGAEAVAGTDPNDLSDFFRIASGSTLEPGGLVLSWMGRTGRVYNVMAGSNLCTWASVYEVPGIGGTQRYTNQLLGQGPKFMRLQVTRE